MRIATAPESSYTARLHARGPSRIAQKVGEEGPELALAGVGPDNEAVVNESADLLYHVLLLLKSRGLTLVEVLRELEARHAAEPRLAARREGRRAADRMTSAPIAV